MDRNPVARIVGNLDGRKYGAVGGAPMLCRATDYTGLPAEAAKTKPAVHSDYRIEASRLPNVAMK